MRSDQIVFGLLSIFLWVLPLAAQPSTQAELQAVETMRQLESERLKAGAEHTLIAPFFDLTDGWSARLVVANRFSAPLGIELTVFDERGTALPLLVETLLPRAHVDVDLSQALTRASRRFRRGSVHVDFFGDDAMVQGWLLLEDRHEGVMEFPLVSVAHAAAAWTTFWDLRQLPDHAGVRPRYFVHNPGTSPVRWRASGAAPSAGAARGGELAPGALSEIRRGAQARGLLKVEAEGGEIVLVGFLEGPGWLARLPAHPGFEAQGAESYESPLLPFPWAARSQPDALRSTYLQAFNSAPEERALSVRVLSPDGVLLAQEQLSVPPESSKGLHWQPAATAPAEATLGVRLQVAYTQDVAVFGQAFSQAGDAVDVAFFPRHEAHSSGTYPLPEIPTNSAWINWTNLGTEETEIVGQLSWEGGTYALGPFSVPGGGSRALFFENLQASAEPDLMGRTLPELIEQGHFQWTVRSGSREVIARTEVRQPGDTDSYGINCVSCCPELPWGEIIPASAVFDVGQAFGFQAVERISTCTGNIGPFPVAPGTMSFSSPLSWNGSTLTTTGFTRQTVGFTAHRERIGLDCRVTTIPIFDDGPVTVDACMDQHGPEGYDERFEAGGCPGQTTSCSTCAACCEKIQNVGKCRCRFGGTACLALANEKCRSCKGACAEKFGIDSCPSTIGDCPL